MARILPSPRTLTSSLTVQIGEVERRLQRRRRLVGVRGVALRRGVQEWMAGPAALLWAVGTGFLLESSPKPGRPIRRVRVLRPIQAIPSSIPPRLLLRWQLWCVICSLALPGASTRRPSESDAAAQAAAPRPPHPISRPGSFARKRPAPASWRRRSGQSSARFRASRQRRSRTLSAAALAVEQRNPEAVFHVIDASLGQADGDGVGHRNRQVFGSSPHRGADIHRLGAHGIGEVIGRLPFPGRAQQVDMAHGDQQGRGMAVRPGRPEGADPVQGLPLWLAIRTVGGGDPEHQVGNGRQSVQSLGREPVRFIPGVSNTRAAVRPSPLQSIRGDGRGRSGRTSKGAVSRPKRPLIRLDLPALARPRTRMRRGSRRGRRHRPALAQGRDWSLG